MASLASADNILKSTLQLGTEVGGWVKSLYTYAAHVHEGRARARLGKLHPLLMWALGVWDASVQQQLVQGKSFDQVRDAMCQLFGHLSALHQLRGSHPGSSVFKMTVKSIEFVLVGDTPPLSTKYAGEPRKIESGLVGALNRAVAAHRELLTEPLLALDDRMRDDALTRAASIFQISSVEVAVADAAHLQVDEAAVASVDNATLFSAEWVDAVTVHLRDIPAVLKGLRKSGAGLNLRQPQPVAAPPEPTFNRASTLTPGLTSGSHEDYFTLCTHKTPLPPLSAEFTKQKQYYETNEEELQARYPGLWICIDGEAVVQTARGQRELAAKLAQDEPRPDSFMVPTWNISMPFIGEVQVQWLPPRNQLSAEVQVQSGQGGWIAFPVKLDTGASLTTITPYIVKELGLRHISNMSIGVASGHMVDVPVYKAELRFDGVTHTIYPPAMARALLGMDVLRSYTVFLGGSERTCHARG